MIEKDFFDGNVTIDWRAVFKKAIDNYIICDVIMGNSRYITVPAELRSVLNKSRIKQTPGEADAKLKVDTNNIKLMEKVKKLKSKQKIHIRVKYPRRGGYFNINTWEVIEIFDDNDLLELSNKTGLFPSEIPQIYRPQETLEKPKKQYKKDIEIAELKEKVVELEKENAQLKSQLQLAIQLLQDKNNMTIEEVQELIGGDNYGTILL